MEMKTDGIANHHTPRNNHFFYRKVTQFSNNNNISANMSSDYIDSMENMLPYLSKNGKSLLKGFYDGSYSLEYSTLDAGEKHNRAVKLYSRHPQRFRSHEPVHTLSDQPPTRSKIGTENSLETSQFETLNRTRAEEDSGTKTEHTPTTLGGRRYLGLAFDPAYEKSAPSHTIRVLLNNIEYPGDLKGVLKKVSKNLKLKKELRYAYLPDGKYVQTLAEIPQNCENIVVYHKSKKLGRSSAVSATVNKEETKRGGIRREKLHDRDLLRGLYGNRMASEKPMRSASSNKKGYPPTNNVNITTVVSEQQNKKTMRLKETSLVERLEKSHDNISSGIRTDGSKGLNRYKYNIRNFSTVGSVKTKAAYECGGDEKAKRVRLRALLQKNRVLLDKSDFPNPLGDCSFKNDVELPKMKSCTAASGGSNHIPAKELDQLENSTGLSRKELLNYYARYKALCLTLNREAEIDGEGIWEKQRLGKPMGLPLKRLLKEIYDCSDYKSELIKQIFELSNKTKTGYLTWEEYAHAMGILQTGKETQQLEVFFQVLSWMGKAQTLAAKGCNYLTCEQVVTLCEKSVSKLEFSTERLAKLSKDFAQLVYKAVHVKEGDNIPLYALKNVRRT